MKGKTANAGGSVSTACIGITKRLAVANLGHPLVLSGGSGFQGRVPDCAVPRDQTGPGALRLATSQAADLQRVHGDSIRRNVYTCKNDGEEAMAYKSADLYLSYVEALDAAEAEVTDWEADFLESLLRRRPRFLSDRQRAIIDAMAERYLHRSVE